MKNLAIILAGAALALTGTAASAKATLAEQGEARLARMLEGRVAGEAVNCINAMNSNRIEVIEHVGIVYDNGGTVWVARAKDPDMLGRWDVPVIERFSSQLCTTDMIRTVDRSDGHFTGAVFLEDFVPYTRQG
jgi:hypothetical protein